MKEIGFDECVRFVIDDLEGGDVIVVDSGGKTRFGISSKAHPTLNIDNLTRAEAETIYLEEYWKPAGCEMLRWPLNLVTFDMAVNDGVAVAVKERLRTFNWLEMLMDRVDAYLRIADSNLEERKDFRGWIRRCVLVYRKAKQ